MAKTQTRQVTSDVVVQTNLEELFEDAHDHVVRSTDPGTRDGVPQDIQIVDDGTNVYLVVKTSRGWFKTASLTAI